MRYFLELRYNGAAYCGWQRQPDQPSVQQTLERALATLLREPVALTGAGRTDTGVNAAYYVAHFDCERPVADPAQTVYKLNFLLPGDIAVGSMTPVAEDAHARFHAREREYRYFIEPRKNPFTRHETWQYYVPLDVGRMNEAAAMLTAYDEQQDQHLPCEGGRLDDRLPRHDVFHDPCGPVFAEYGAVAGRHAGRRGARTLHARRVPLDRREPRPVAVERRRTGPGVVSLGRGLPGGHIRTSMFL